MSTNGQLVFTDVDKITFKGVGNASNAVIDTLTGKIGVGVDSPEANLHVLGNSYVSTNLELGGTLIMGTVNVEAQHSLEAVTATGNITPLTLEFTNPTTSLVASGNVEVAGVVGTSGTGALTVPSGTTVQQPTGVVGMIRFNTDNDILEHYTSSGWKIIVGAPIITSFSGVINENVSSTLIIHGLYFSSGCIVTIRGAAVGGVDRSLVTTFVNSNKVTVNTDASSTNYVSGASYDIKIVLPSGNEFTLTQAGVVDATQTWITSGTSVASPGVPVRNIGIYYDRTALRGRELTISYQLEASDSDNDSIIYSLTSGTLPTGVYVSTSGLISGDPDDEATSDTTYPFGISIISNSIAVERTFNFVIKRRYGLTSDRVATSVDQFHPSLDSNGLYYMDIGIGAGTQQYFVDFNMVGGPYIMIARNMTSQTGTSATFGIQNTGSTAGNYTDTAHFNTNITGINPTVYVVRNNNTYYAKFDLDTSSRNAIYAELQDTAGETSNGTNANSAFTIPSGGVYKADGTYVNTWTSSDAIIELHHGGWSATSSINYIIEVGRNTRSHGSGGDGTYTGFSSQGKIILKGDGTRSLGNIDYHFIRI